LTRSLALGVGLFIAACHAGAEKRITVKITHPPVLAEALAGKGVALGAISGDCAQEFADLLVEDMRAHGVVMGASLLPTVALSIAVTRCEAHTLAPILGGGLPAIHISRTEGAFLAAVRAADAANGRELANVTVRGHAQKENESQSLAPEYPAPAEVKSMALHQGLAEAQRLYAPWMESREIAFADSKECHLKQAFDLAKAGDYDALLRLSQANAEACAGSKTAMEADYNLGVAYMLVRKYDEAVAAFQKAAELNGGKLVAGLLDECRKDAAALQARQPKTPHAAPGKRAQTGILMTNDFVIRLVDGNIAEDEILKMIANQPGRFSLEPADVSRLQAAHVPDSIIGAMRNKK
jgi:hypothetical protein